jgi:hypothetical protein
VSSGRRVLAIRMTSVYSTRLFRLRALQIGATVSGPE